MRRGARRRKLPLLEVWVHHSVREAFTTDTNALQYTVTGELREEAWRRGLVSGFGQLVCGDRFRSTYLVHDQVRIDDTCKVQLRSESGQIYPLSGAHAPVSG